MGEAEGHGFIFASWSSQLSPCSGRSTKDRAAETKARVLHKRNIKQFRDGHFVSALRKERRGAVNPTMRS